MFLSKIQSPRCITKGWCENGVYHKRLKYMYQERLKRGVIHSSRFCISTETDTFISSSISDKPSNFKALRQKRESTFCDTFQPFVIHLYIANSSQKHREALILLAFRGINLLWYTRPLYTLLYIKYYSRGPKECLTKCWNVLLHGRRDTIKLRTQDYKREGGFLVFEEQSSTKRNLGQ